MSPLKDLFDKGKCLVGFHQGEWSFDCPGSCAQTRVCVICSARDAHVEHGWSEWQTRGGPGCEHTRRCRRCDEAENRIEHAWGGWEYVDDDACEQRSMCSRCQAFGDETRVVHVWGPWVYDEDHRAPLKTCMRCWQRVSRFQQQIIEAAPRVVENSAPELNAHESTPSSDRQDQRLFDPGGLDDPRVVEIGRTLAAGDPKALAALADAWITTGLLGDQKVFVRSALIEGALESRLLAACWAADPHARGADPALGLSVGQAICHLAQVEFVQTGAPAYLSVVATATNLCLLAYAAQGRHAELALIATAADDWLVSRGYTDARAPLLMSAVEACIDSGQLEQAGEMLNVVGSLTILDDRPAEQERLRQLRRRFDAVARQRATDLAPAPVEADASFRSDLDELKGMIASAGTLNQSLFGDAGPFRDVLATLGADVGANAPQTQAEWLARTKTTRAALTELLSGASGGMTPLFNRQRGIDAGAIFGDPVKGRDPAAIEVSLATLLEVKDWAQAHDCADDVDDALWALYLCYSRTNRVSQAIDMLQALRSHLEAKRVHIADPLERAGVFGAYPALFGSLCRLLCREGRAEEQFDAIEGGKGRLLADMCARRSVVAVADATFRVPLERLKSRLSALQAHYLSYLVDEEDTYAVLVAKDGTLHSMRIEIGKERLRQLSESIDPTRWSRSRAGFFAPPAASVLEGLAPLVSCLEPVMESGVIEPGDHLCYCPDEYIHLVPLHYLPLGGAPLATHVSVSRIHSGAALVQLLENDAEVPSQFVSVHVPAMQDLGDSVKLRALARVSGWLSEHLSGSTLSRERATPEALADAHVTRCILHFSTHGTFPRIRPDGSNPNPFSSSGLALASNGTLPSLEALTSGAGKNGLLTPERVMGMNLNGSHVTAQACVTGLAKEGIGGDALGLDLAFLLAGATSVLTTHWDVSAQASADFSVRFYEHWLMDKRSRADAWRQAVLESRQSDGPRDRPPEYYWAAFSLSGDWR